MKILSTASLLGLTLLAVPVFTYLFGTPLGQTEYDVLKILVYVTVSSMVYCFVVGEITGNNSQVDKLWSILPIVYVWIVTWKGDFSPRLVIMAVLATLWGIRLTANFALKGAYSWKFWDGEEDYRWKILREKPEFTPRWKWTLFNLFFISGYQNVLILLFTLPALVALQNKEVPLQSLDYVITGLTLIFILYETIADIQQWNFQSKKWSMIKAGISLEGDYAKGFLDRGLWAYCRHPNYFAEQMIWVCFYLFSITASGLWFNWSVIGCLLLIVLFTGSATFSEEISASRYSGYRAYQQRVSRFLPWPPNS
jgi:steroid 5-alpha reductase family enzyme